MTGPKSILTLFDLPPSPRPPRPGESPVPAGAQPARPTPTAPPAVAAPPADNPLFRSPQAPPPTPAAPPSPPSPQASRAAPPATIPAPLRGRLPWEREEDVPRPAGGDAAPAGPRIYKVTELCRDIRVGLEQRYRSVTVEGEITGFKAQGNSGHWYFSLKDAGGTLRSVMFQGDNRYARFEPADGMVVQATGQVSFYEVRGDAQLLVKRMEPAGAGALAAALEKLRKKLQAEGLFDERRKRPLPPHPRTVGVVTSLEGAALRDILATLKRRAPGVNVVVSGARVQGPGAAGEIRVALQRLDASRRADVIIIGRGGGSAEDLSAFNDESLARAVAACTTPTISAVGHDVDTTIIDFIADRRASTPTAAAELAAPDHVELGARLGTLHARLVRGMRGRLESAHLRLARAEKKIPQPQALLHRQSQRLDDLEARALAVLRSMMARQRDRLGLLDQRLSRGHPRVLVAQQRRRLDGLGHTLEAAIRTRMAGAHQRMATAGATLDALSPLKVLGRGYALVSREADGRVVRTAEDAPAGTALRIRVGDGEVGASSTGPRRRNDVKGGGGA